MTQETELDGAVYFNNCTNNLPPNWSQFELLEIGVSAMQFDHQGMPEYYVRVFTEAITPDDKIIWTIYGRYPDGDCEAITDCATCEDAKEIGKTLSEISGLKVNNCF